MFGVVGQVGAALLVASASVPGQYAEPSLGPEYFPDRSQVAAVLDLDRPWKIQVDYTPVDGYFGTVPKRCDITRHLGRGVFNGEAKYWYQTSSYVIYPTIEVRAYASVARAAVVFRDVRARFQSCKNRKWIEPPTPGGGGEIVWSPYRAPRIGNATFGFVSVYDGEGGPTKSRIIVARKGDVITYVQGMNYAGKVLPTPSRKPYAQLTRLAVRKATD